MIGLNYLQTYILNHNNVYGIHLGSKRNVILLLDGCSLPETVRDIDRFIEHNNPPLTMDWKIKYPFRL